MEESEKEKNLVYLKNNIEEHKVNGKKYAFVIAGLTAAGMGIAAISKMTGLDPEAVHLILQCTGGFLVTSASILRVHYKNTSALEDEYNNALADYYDSKKGGMSL